jgi:hypothetical protein
MTAIRSLSFVLGMLLLLSPLALSAGVGSCHPYPGASAPDCLELIGNNFRNEDELVCEKGTGRATLTLRSCSITTKCGPDVTGVITDEVVRRALTSIGACALNDRGSISGDYTAADGSKTCYLYPGG